MPAFTTELNIANLACAIIGVPSISDFTSTKTGTVINGVYDQLREGELQSNLWRFSTREVMLRAILPSSLVWTPPTYSGATTYAMGHVVVDSNGIWWQSKVASNVGHTPDIGSYWGRYFGVDYTTPFVAPATSQSSPAAPALTNVTSGALGAATYYAKVTYNSASGETLPSGESSVAIVANDLPKITSPAASTGATSWNAYMSTVSGQETLQSATISIGTDFTLPTTGLVNGAGLPTAGGLTYWAGELTKLGSTVYLSLISNNTAAPPNSTWLAVNGTTSTLQILYPIGAGPGIQTSTRNAFRLPHGFLRQAPSNPKGAANVWQGLMRGNAREDWVFEGDYISSWATGPILLRFVADFVDVPDMSALFCRGLAGKIAQYVCQPLTQSQEKMADANKAYDDAIFRARITNAIEIGPVDPDLDDLIACRI